MFEASYKAGYAVDLSQKMLKKEDEPHALQFGSFNVSLSAFIHAGYKKSPLRPFISSIPIADLPNNGFPLYALVANEEIDLLKGVQEFDDLTHKRRQWYRIYEHTFNAGGRPSYPSIEYNLDRHICSSNREPLFPENFFRLF